MGVQVNSIPMIQACAGGQCQKYDSDLWNGVDWAKLPSSPSAIYDLCPEAYLDPGCDSAIHRQMLVSVKVEGWPRV